MSALLLGNCTRGAAILRPCARLMSASAGGSSASSSTPSSSKAVPAPPPYQSAATPPPSKEPVGPGATKEGDYKCTEYFCYSNTSYFDLEAEMVKDRLPQPVAENGRM